MNPIEVEKYREQILSEFADHTSDNQSDWVDTILRQFGEDVREECAILMREKLKGECRCGICMEFRKKAEELIRLIEIK